METWLIAGLIYLTVWLMPAALFAAITLLDLMDDRGRQ